VDWYEAYADIGGEREKAYVFCMRSMASGGAFHCAFPHSSQQAFFGSTRTGVCHFIGSFKTLRYDNLKSAVRRFLGVTAGGDDTFIASDRIGAFQSEFCTPGEGHEKADGRRRGIFFVGSHGAGPASGQLGGP